MAITRNTSKKGVDINKMMSQASSFTSDAKRKSTSKFHEITIPRSEHTPTAYAHELTPSGNDDQDERTPDGTNELNPERSGTTTGRRVTFLADLLNAPADSQEATDDTAEHSSQQRPILRPPTGTLEPTQYSFFDDSLLLQTVTETTATASHPIAASTAQEGDTEPNAKPAPKPLLLCLLGSKRTRCLRQ